MRLQFSVLPALALFACSSSPTERVDVELNLTGTQLVDLALDAQTQLRVDRADIAFGPLYLCSGTQAGALCDSALLEWRESAVVDVAVSSSETVGALSGLSGTVRSFMFDFAMPSTLASDRPLQLDAADALGGYSARLAGAVLQNGVEVPFSMALTIARSDSGEPGMPVVRSSQALDLEVTPETESMTVSFDATTWFAALQARDFFQSQACTLEQQLTCQGQIEQSCDETGVLKQTRDCSALSQVCAPDRGCVDEVDFTKDTRAYRAVVQAMVSGTGPDFSIKTRAQK